MNFKLWLENYQDAQTISNEIANKLHCKKGGSCLAFAELATKELLKNNINNFVVVEGWIKARNEVFWRQHTWLEMEGQKIDPTFAQFDHLKEPKYVSKIKRKYHPNEYLIMCQKFPTPNDEYLKDQNSV